MFGTIKIEVPNMTPFLAEFGGLQQDLLDLSPIWPDVIDNAIRPALDTQFQSEGDIGEHGGWRELTPDYAARKRSKYGDVGIEVASGRMMNSLLFDTADTIKNMTANMLEFGTSVKSKDGFPYAIAQQTGHRTRLGKGKAKGYKEKKDGLFWVAARRIFDFSDIQREDIITGIHRAIVDCINRPGRARKLINFTHISSEMGREKFKSSFGTFLASRNMEDSF